MATYYAINTGGTWNTGSTWSTISAKDATRVGGVTAPTSSDTCILDDFSGNVTLNAGSVCLNIDENSNGVYANILAFGTQTLTVSGVATLQGAMTASTGILSVAGGVTLVGTPTGSFPILTISGASSLTSGGFTWGGQLKLSVAGVVKLLGAWINSGIVTYTASTSLQYNTISSETLTCNGNLISTATPGTAGNLATIILGAAQNISMASLLNPVNVNTTGQITFTGNWTQAGLLTINSAANFNNGGGGAVMLCGGGVTLNSNWGTSITLANIQIRFNNSGTNVLTSNGYSCYQPISTNTSGIVKLSGAWINYGIFTHTSGASLQYNSVSSETLTCAGGYTINQTTGSSGNLAIIILAGGEYTDTTSGHTIYNPFVINPTASAVTISSGSYITPRNLTYTTGSYNVITTGSYIWIAGVITINSPIDGYFTGWNIILCQAVSTCTLSNALKCTTLALQATLTFAGTYDITCDNFYGQPTSANAAGVKIVNGRTLTITTAVYVPGVYYTNALASNLFTIQSTTAAYANLVYQGTAANCRIYASTFTWIDASGSEQVIDNWYGGTLSNTVNVVNRTSADIGGGAPTGGGWYGGD